VVPWQTYHRLIAGFLCLPVSAEANMIKENPHQDGFSAKNSPHEKPNFESKVSSIINIESSDAISLLKGN
jgi:hypothetical protein